VTALPAFRPTGSPLHRARLPVSLLFLAVPAAGAVLFSHPLLLAAVLAATLAAGAGAGVLRELGRAARLAVPLALLVALVNPLVSREGITLLWNGPAVPVLGRLDVTLEAVAWGGVAALRALDVVLAFALYSAVVDPDAILRYARRASVRSALSATLATRLVPVLARDAERLAAAYPLRAASPLRTAHFPRLRRAALLARALTGGALERAVDAAAALEVRGFGAASARTAPPARAPWSPADTRMLAGALAGCGAVAVGLLGGVGAFDAYPELRASFGVEEALVAVALVAAAIGPFLGASLPPPRRRR
jgi:energy-coupling factor transport system permease protein